MERITIQSMNIENIFGNSTIFIWRCWIFSNFQGNPRDIENIWEFAPALLCWMSSTFAVTCSDQAKHAWILHAQKVLDAGDEEEDATEKNGTRLGCPMSWTGVQYDATVGDCRAYSSSTAENPASFHPHSRTQHSQVIFIRVSRGFNVRI